jgi:hypothetical protein
VVDDPLLLQNLGHGLRARAARDDDVLGLIERPRRAQQLIAEPQRAAHQGDEQHDEEQDPTEIAEHAQLR